MRKLIMCLIAISFLFSCNTEEPHGDSYFKKMKKYRYRMNVSFSDKTTSPLKPEDLRDFKTLDFFPIDSNYRVKAEFKRVKNAPFMEMETNTNSKVLYKVYGTATFELDGKKHTLNLYQNQKMDFTGEFNDRLFIPFHDTTNGKETYEGGRYMEVDVPNKKTLIIDFNKAFNPYCVYNDKYVCPVVPPVNTLDIPIDAGVKNFKK
ncbi:DUF1684 domain-containing protein [Aureivirga sp. CE67]|uniref:DUF1684 domain-containing protein n=1 Tax=Aureivirga sp. CE67 TaxID=1788983 RepID=UPI0018C92DAA|nr:DUF1684 domain-containing protein [Aureivirga sp. CE67]